MGMFHLLAALAHAADGPEHDIPITPGSAVPAAPTDPAPVSAPAADPAAPESVPVTAPEAGEADPADRPPDREIALTPEERQARAATAYVRALDAWKQSKWERSWRLASEALSLDPTLSPARLLAGYALLRLDRLEEARVTLEGLELEPEESPIPDGARAGAARVLRAKLAPYQRSDAWFEVGNITYVQRTGDTAVPLNGWVLALQVPLLVNLAVRADGGAPWPGTASDLDIRGPRFDVQAVAELPVDRGRWHVDLGAGPALWVATGGYWPDQWQPFFGVRAATGTDVRLGPAFGLRFEAGFSVFPGAAADIPWYAEPLDLRLALQGWIPVKKKQTLEAVD